MKLKLAFVALTAIGITAGCAITPEQFETTPVQLNTAQGPVVCQLYTLEQVTWDRSITRPAAMSVDTADTLCRNEGHRIIRDGAEGLVQEGHVLVETRPL